MEKIKLIIRVIASNIGLLCRIIIGTKISYQVKSLVSPIASLRTFRNGKIEFGEKIEIRPNTELTARDGNIRIGNSCFINRNCMIVSHRHIELGDNVTVGPGTMIYDHDHDNLGGYSCDSIKIGKNVWIGANCVILKGVMIEDNCVIGAGTIVSKNVEKDTQLIQKRENMYYCLKNRGESKSI